MHKLKGILVLAGLMMLVFSAAAHSQDDKVLARIGNGVIMVSEFEKEMRMYGKAGNFQEKLLTLTPKGRKNILDKIVRERLLYQAAMDSDTKLDSKTEEYLERLRQNLLVKKYIADTLVQKPITEEELRSYWERHQEEFIIPEKRKVQQIIVSTREKADKILDQLKKGQDFAELAKKNNIDGTKNTGGDLEWIRRGTMVEEFDEIAFSLPQGQLSGIVKTRFGYHIILVEQIKETLRRKFRDVIKTVRTKVENERIREVEENLKQRYEVRINYEIVDKNYGQEATNAEKSQKR